MAGGRGERLKPITDNLPKPMIDVSGKPVLEHIIDIFKKYSVNEFIFTVCYLSEKIVSYFGNGSKFGIKINYIYEDSDNPLGTAGGVAKAAKYINDDFIVTSGDILRKIDIKEMVKFHNDKKSFATLNTYKRYDPNPKSTIRFDKSHKIINFIERPDISKIKDDFVWANGSFYILKPEILSYISQGKKVDFGKDVFPHLLKEGKNMYAYPTKDYFIDIGNLEKLKKARDTFVSTK